MATVKIILDNGTLYSGPSERGQVQTTLSDLVDKIIKNKARLKVPTKQKERTITFRLDSEKIEQLKEIAGTHNISVQSLLRLSMAQNNLLIQIN